MQKIFTLYLPGLGLLLLLAATIVLASYNFNSKIQNLILTGIFVGTATTFVTLVVGLKSITIEHSFITSVIMNESSHLPIFITNPTTPLEQRLSKLNIIGRPARRNDSGIPIQTIQSPSTFDETITFAGELSQYAILNAIKEMHFKIEGSSMKMENEHTYVEPIIHRPIVPPFKTKFFKNDLAHALKQNRFSDSESEDRNWEIVPLILPKGTNLELIHIPSSPETGPETYEILLSKPRFFEIEFNIQPSIQPSQGAIPRNLTISREEEKQSRVYYFVVEAKATLPAITAENPHRKEYRKWIEWMLSEIENRIKDQSITRF